MFNEIEILESLVHDYLCNCQITSDDNTSGNHDSASMVKLIRKALITNVFELKKEQLIEIYIQDVQMRLINLSNNVYGYTVRKSNFNEKERKHQLESGKSLLETLDNLLIFLSNSFSKYVNQELHVPDNLKDKAIFDFEKEIGKIEILFQEHERDLLNISLIPIRLFIENKHSISYHRLDYFCFLLQELPCFKGSLEKGLILLNFNSFSFLHALTLEIENDLEEIDSYTGKMERLYWKLKWIKQIQITDKTYNKSVKPLKDLLIDWINEEISYLEKAVTLEKLPKIETAASEEKEFKLITDLSVSQLGFLLRVFMDSGLFKNKNHRAMARFFARHTKSKGSAAISPGNLLNKFYDVSGNVEEVVKGIVFDMLNQIRKY